MAKITRKQKAIKLKRKLEREFSVTRKYKTTYKDIKKYFNELNFAIFDNKLSPFGQIKIKNLAREKCIGQVVIYLRLPDSSRLSFLLSLSALDFLVVTI